MRTRQELNAYGREYRKKNREVLRIKDAARYRANRKKCRARNLAYHHANREKRNAARRARRRENAEKMRAQGRAYYRANRKRIAVQAAGYQRRRNARPYARIVNNLRRRVLLALAGRGKSAPTLRLLGCSRSELRAHLESKFKPGMTWENYGPVWHVDHIKPCAKFNLSDPEQQKICFHWTNLQPLFAKENLKKGARV